MRAECLLVLCLATAAAAQQPPTTSPRQPVSGTDTSTATAVSVDVVVRDRSGRPVTGLVADDFEVYEDGARQVIGSFRPPEPAAPATSAETIGPTPVAASGSAAAPVVVLVFDRLSVESRDLATRAAARYIGDGPQSAATMALFDIDQSLRVLQPFTRDAALLRASLPGVSARQPSGPGALLTADTRGALQAGLVGRRPGAVSELEMANAGPLSTAGDSYGNPALAAVMGTTTSRFAEFERDVAGYTQYNAITAVAEGLALVPGRKTLLLFSEGLALTRNTDARLDALIGRVNRANVAVYAVDAAGLRTDSPQTFLGRQLAASTNDSSGNLSTNGAPESSSEVLRLDPAVGLTMLSTQTGGRVIRSTNDLSRAFERVNEDVRSYYLLTYVPPRPEQPGFRKLRVRVNKPGLSASARSGYVARPLSARETSVLAYEAAALGILEAAPATNDFPIHARGLVFPSSSGPARASIVVTAPAAVLAYGRDPDADTFAAAATVLVRVRDAAGQVVHKASEQYAFTGRLGAFEASRASHVLFYRQPQLEPGVYALEAVIRDERSGRASVRISTLEVRDAASPLQVSTVFIVDRAEQVPVPERDPHNPLYFGDLLLYPNLATPLVPSKDPAVTFAFVAVAPRGVQPVAIVEVLQHGAVIGQAPLRVEAPGADGTVRQLSRMPITTLAPGAYQLRLTIEAGANRVTRTASFAIAGARSD